MSNLWLLMRAIARLAVGSLAVVGILAALYMVGSITPWGRFMARAGAGAFGDIVGGALAIPVAVLSLIALCWIAQLGGSIIEKFHMKRGPEVPKP